MLLRRLSLCLQDSLPVLPSKSTTVVLKLKLSLVCDVIEGCGFTHAWSTDFIKCVFTALGCTLWAVCWPCSMKVSVIIFVMTMDDLLQSLLLFIIDTIAEYSHPSPFVYFTLKKPNMTKNYVWHRETVWFLLTYCTFTCLPHNITTKSTRRWFNYFNPLHMFCMSPTTNVLLYSLVLFFFLKLYLN